jgi:ABC-type microcin C transport system duplicated ATPase subunit YejF
VQIPSPERRLKAYPFELSGGMRQRVVIAMALVSNPALLLADEPTTALDVTVQARVLDLFRDLKDRLGMGVIFVTHDLSVAAEIADDIAVMYAGRIVEIRHGPRHRALAAAPVHAGPARGERAAGSGRPSDGDPGRTPEPREPAARVLFRAAVRRPSRTAAGMACLN